MGSDTLALWCVALEAPAPRDAFAPSVTGRGEDNPSSNSERNPIQSAAQLIHEAHSSTCGGQHYLQLHVHTVQGG